MKENMKRFGRYHQKDWKQAEGKFIENFSEVLLFSNGGRVIQKGDSLHGYRNPRK